MKNILKTDLSRAFLSLRFPCAVFLMYLVWELNRQRFGSAEDVLYLFIHVWGRSITFLLAMVVSAVGYTTAYCEDVEFHFLQYAVLRTNVSRYVISKIFTCFFSSFLIVFLGTSLFLAVQSLTLPLTAEESIAVENFQTISCFGNLLAQDTILFIGLQTMVISLSCGGLSVLALAFSVFIKNSYGVFAVPFLLHYCFFYLLGKLSGKYPIFAIERVFDCVNTYTDNPVFFLLYAVLVVIVFVLTGYGIMYKKVKEVFQ